MTQAQSGTGQSQPQQQPAFNDALIIFYEKIEDILQKKDEIIEELREQDAPNAYAVAHMTGYKSAFHTFINTSLADFLQKYRGYFVSKSVLEKDWKRAVSDDEFDEWIGNEADQLYKTNSFPARPQDFRHITTILMELFVDEECGEASVAAGLAEYKEATGQALNQSAFMNGMTEALQDISAAVDQCMVEVGAVNVPKNPKPAGFYDRFKVK